MLNFTSFNISLSFFGKRHFQFAQLASSNSPLARCIRLHHLPSIWVFKRGAEALQAVQSGFNLTREIAQAATGFSSSKVCSGTESRT